jgi:hypothetical protein
MPTRLSRAASTRTSFRAVPYNNAPFRQLSPPVARFSKSRRDRDADKEASLCGMWANAILYLVETGRVHAATAYEEAAVNEEAPDWLPLFAQVGVDVDPVHLSHWLKKRLSMPGHSAELDEVRKRLIDRRRQSKEVG